MSGDLLSMLFWYLAVSLLGLLVFPLAYRLLPGLVDRGYAIARALSLLLWGFGFWLLSSLGGLPNDLGGYAVVFVLLLGLSGWALRGLRKGELADWLRANRRTVVTVEVLFLLAFVGWSLVRAGNPNITYTEKPMELAFINAILRSPTMPPHDPWLSGYAISYYYFGYLLVAMLARLTGTVAGVAFNLGGALVFALTAVGAYGLVYNLLNIGRADMPRKRFVLPLLAPFFTLLVSNLEGFLEVLHARGLFWKADASGTLTSRFWTWLDILDLNSAPTLPYQGWDPRYFWWWRASRVVRDYSFAGSPLEIIDEFPFFSYLLADLHPHVLVMPFVFLGLAVALNLFLSKDGRQIRLWNMELEIAPAGFALAAVVYGGLAFLNIWDFPVYLALFAAAYALRRAREGGWNWKRLGDFVLAGGSVGALAVALYLPFFIGFSSQAGGIIPSLLFPTRGAHLWVMFGAWFLIFGAYLAYLWRVHGDASSLWRGLGLGLGITALLTVLTLLLALLVAVGLPLMGSSLTLESLVSMAGAPSLSALMTESLNRHLISNGGWITLTLLLGAVLGLLWLYWSRRERDGEARLSPAHGFALLLVLFGTLVVFVPEFVYLKDQFGWRINTIFKFYYQGWQMWSAAAAFGVAVLLLNLRETWAWLFRIGLVLVLAAGLCYTVLGLWDVTGGFKFPNGLHLDGTLHNAYLTEEDVAAVAWLDEVPLGVLAEAVHAVSGSYTNYARISAHTGLPAVLGWRGHESQWRGGYQEMGTRPEDIQRLYETSSWQEASQIIQMYDIRYIYVGELEHATYRVDRSKFAQHLIPVFEQGVVVIYQVP